MSMLGNGGGMLGETREEGEKQAGQMSRGRRKEEGGDWSRGKPTPAQRTSRRLLILIADNCSEEDEAARN